MNSPVEAAEKMILPQFDGLFNAACNELSGLSILAFAEGRSSYAEMYHRIHAWQEGASLGTTPLDRETLRQQALKLETCGIIMLDGFSSGERGHKVKAFSLTETGIVAASLAGLLLNRVSLGQNVNMSRTFPAAVNIAATFDDGHTRLSPGLMRSFMLFRLQNRAAAGSPTVRAARFESSPGFDQLQLTNPIIRGHLKDLADDGYVKLVKKGVGRAPKSDHFRISQKGDEIATTLREIVEGVFFIDDDWVDVIASGLDEARKVLSVPNVVSQLLRKREVGAVCSYQMSAPEMERVAIDLARNNGLISSGEIRKALGGKHSLQYISNRVKAMVEKGILERVEAAAPKNVRYRLPSI